MRTQCNCDSNLKNFDNCSKSLEWLKPYGKRKIEDLKRDYETLITTQIDQSWYLKVQKQIERDIRRTYPHDEFFSSQEGLDSLQRVLTGIAVFDPKVGYVQGMNFLVGALLFHSSEHVAFWNYVLIYEKLELRDIYLENLPGLSKHTQIIQLLCMSYDRPLYNHLISNQIQFENFCIPWFLSLLAMVVPIQQYKRVFAQLLTIGWSSFYKIILSYLRTKGFTSINGPELMLSLTNSNRLNQEEKIEWSDILDEQYQLDQKFICAMLNSFDSEKQTFLMR